MTVNKTKFYSASASRTKTSCNLQKSTNQNRTKTKKTPRYNVLMEKNEWYPLLESGLYNSASCEEGI